MHVWPELLFFFFRPSPESPSTLIAVLRSPITEMHRSYARILLFVLAASLLSAAWAFPSKARYVKRPAERRTRGTRPSSPFFASFDPLSHPHPSSAYFMRLLTLIVSVMTVGGSLQSRHVLADPPHFLRPSPASFPPAKMLPILSYPPSTTSLFMLPSYAYVSFWPFWFTRPPFPCTPPVFGFFRSFTFFFCYLSFS